jgi:hypothetical protein
MRSSTIKAVMNAIARGEISRAVAAERLGGISERHVNRLMVVHNVTRPRSQAAEEREDARALSEERRQMKDDNAEACAAGRQSIEEAAVNAGCSERTMYRWVARIKKHAVSSKKRRKATKK